jgi:hypothetical protein
MTLDINAKGQPKWTGVGGGTGAIGCQGGGGDNILVQNVKIINFGTPTRLVECFPIEVFGNSQATYSLMHNIVIDSCIFTSPATGNKDGLTCCGINDNPPAPGNIYADSTCKISNCQFLDCNSDFSYVHCYGAPTCTGNYSINSGIGYYAEPIRSQFPGITVEISGNTCINMNRLVYVLFHPDGQMPNFDIHNNIIMYPADNSLCSGIQFTGGGVTFSPVALVGNVNIYENEIFSNSAAGQVWGINIDEHGQFDMTIRSLKIYNNYLYNFDPSQNQQIILDSSTQTIQSRSVTNSYIQTGI